MASSRFDDFGALYRAAFAENNPEKKRELLSAVQNAINGNSSEPIESPVVLKFPASSTKTTTKAFLQSAR